MKRIISLVLILVLVLTFGGCKKKKEEVEDNTLSPGDLPGKVFSSEFILALDKTDWYTSLVLKDDATFEGNYHSEKNGTVYYCNFYGKFTDIKKINDYSYSLVLESLNYDDYIGKKTVKNGKEYKAEYPYGLEKGKRFILYTPDTPVSELSTNVLAWWPKLKEHYKEPYKTLSTYALVNTNEETNYAFFICEE